MFTHAPRPWRPGARALAYAAALFLACQSSEEGAPAPGAGGSGGEPGHGHLPAGADSGGDEGDTSNGGAAPSAGGAKPAAAGERGAGAGPDAGSAGDSGAAGSAGADGMNAAVPVLNGCTAYVDRTNDAASRTLPWTDDTAHAPERCMKIRAEQRVTFSGDFVEHPLAPRGGDTPNPVMSPSTTFPNAGVFGYVCTTHPPMIGAIWDVP